jgi:acyl carrier protein
MDVKLVSEDGQEVPRGQVGEIVAVSPGLAEGYWQLPELTASRFRRLDPADPVPAYFTGDLGRWMADGLLQHVGRVDHMVKIRGYQVFPGELETLLREVAGVVEACVTAHSLPQGVQQLAAYLVVDGQRFPGVPALYARFEDVPAHMVPHVFVLVDTMPRTPNGKIDRQRLPVPQRSRLSVTAEYAGARNRIEEILTRIWGRVLGIEGVGINDNFLELGGDSMDSTRIINQVVTAFSIEVPYSAFFNALTIAEMAMVIRAALPRSDVYAKP